METICNLYSSATAVRVIKSRRMKWAGKEALMREILNANSASWETSREEIICGYRHRWKEDIKMDNRGSY
jgi:hypothetical protein